MNKLENHIREKREDFNDNMPPEGHFERFMKKLPEKRKFQFDFLKIASVLIFGLLITTIGIYSIRSFNSSKQVYASQENDLNEAINYYAGINSELENTINNMEFEDSAQKEELLSDIKLYDEALGDIEKDLENFPEEERVKNAAISHYKGKTALLNIIISQ